MAAPSLAAQRAFYEEALELAVRAASQEELAVQAGDTELVFRAAPPGSAPSYHFAFRIPGDQFREAKDWLRARTNLIRRQGSDEFRWDAWEAAAVYTHDPAGNVVELLAFHGLAERAHAGFSSRSLLGLAELGLPVRDVRVIVALLAESFSIGLWDRQAPSPNQITPIGERGASFIVASLGRRWFLGGPSGDYPLEILLEGVQEGELQLGQAVHIRGSD